MQCIGYAWGWAFRRWHREALGIGIPFFYDWANHVVRVLGLRESCAVYIE